MNKPLQFMQHALNEASLCIKRNEVPVGAVVVDASGKIIASAGNEVLKQHDVTAHAEILAIRRASKLIESERLIDCDLYVTLEPCPMCAAAISMARFRRLYFGAYDVKSGGVEHGAQIFDASSCHHRPEIYGGIGEQEASDMLQKFFRDKR